MNTATRFSFSQIDPDWERPSPPPASLRRDVWVWLAVLAVTLLLNAAYHSAGLLGSDSKDLTNSYWVAAAMTLPLVARRRFPLTMMLVATALFFLLSYQSYLAAATISYQLSYFAVLYAGVAWGKNRALTWAVYALICLVSFLWVAVSWVVTDSAYQLSGIEPFEGGPMSQATAGYIMSIVSNVFYFGCAAMMGRTSWNQAYQRTVLAAQAAQLEAQSQQMAKDAVTRDRLRIARELHDSVGHHVSSMGIQAAAARRALTKKPELATEPLANIEKLARSSVTEMKNLIRVLRAPDDLDTAPSTAKEPQVTDIFTLVEENTTAGLTTHLQVSDLDLARLNHLQQGTQLSIYRIVQEALTNIRKHSTAHRAVIALRTLGEPGQLTANIEITDDGVGYAGSNPTGSTEGQEYKPLEPAPGSPRGYGIQGIKERATALGGTAWIGRRTGTNGWKVQVHFPLNLDEQDETDILRKLP